ncbi:MAG: kelch repeat-containing protein, partial [Myxococcota bacterium]
MSRSVKMALFAAALVAGCGAQLELDDAVISCSSLGECPDGLRCNTTSQLCVPAEGGEQDPPQIVSATVPTTELNESAVLQVTLTVNEPLLTSPLVTFVDGARAVELTELEEESAELTFVYAYEVTGEEAEGARALSVNLVDLAGNQTNEVLPDTIRFDFTDPGLFGAPQLELLPASANPLDIVTASTVGTTVLIELDSNETLSSPPMISSTPTALAFVCTNFDVTRWRCEATVEAGATEGVQTVTALLIDEATNQSTVELGLSGESFPEGWVVDTVAPSPPTVDVEQAIVLQRAPVGTEDSNPRLRLQGRCQAGVATGAVEALATVRVFEDQAGLLEIGRVNANEAGGFGEGVNCTGTAFVLPFADAPVVFVQAVDGAGNSSAVVAVRDIEMTLNFSGKIGGSFSENPHQFEAYPVFPRFAALERPVLPGESAGITAEDGNVFTTTSRTYWERSMGAPPFGGMDMAITESPESGSAVAFGGEGSCSCARQICDNTWRHERDGWVEVTPIDPEDDGDPSRRSQAGLAVIPRTGNVLLFGGKGPDGLLGDSWIFDGSSWRAVCTDGCTSPTPRRGATLTTDPLNGVVWLFGGFTDEGDTNELWRFSNERWEQVCTDGECASTLPTARSGHGAVSGADGGFWLFGGTSGGDELWFFDGERFESLCDAACRSTGPSARTRFGFARNPVTGELFVVGGDSGISFSDRCFSREFLETWVWTDAGWEDRTDRLDSSWPEPIFGVRAFYDRRLGRILLQGGDIAVCSAVGGCTQSDQNLTREWDAGAGRWSTLVARAAPALNNHGGAVLPATGRVYVVGGNTPFGTLPTSAVLSWRNGWRAESSLGVGVSGV